MSLPHLSLTDARHLHLAAQGLLKKTGLLFAAQRFYADTSPHAGPGEYGLEV